MYLLQSLRNRPLTYYVILNYLISWSFLYPAYQAILNAEDGTFPLLALLGIPGGFGPTIAAIIVVRITEGKQALYQLLGKYKKFKVHIKWYFFVLVFFLIVQSLIRLFGVGQKALQKIFCICKYQFDKG